MNIPSHSSYRCQDKLFCKLWPSLSCCVLIGILRKTASSHFGFLLRCPIHTLQSTASLHWQWSRHRRLTKWITTLEVVATSVSPVMRRHSALGEFGCGMEWLENPILFSPIFPKSIIWWSSGLTKMFSLLISSTMTTEISLTLYTAEDLWFF